jgi:hypothetical protein
MARIFLSTVLIGIVASSAMGHPGHGSTQGFSPLHYVLEPEHGSLAAAAVLMTVALGAGGLRRFRARHRG